MKLQWVMLIFKEKKYKKKNMSSSSSSYSQYENQLMQVEGLYLQKMARNSLSDTSECTGVDLHECTMSCHMNSLDPQQSFQYRGIIYLATGYVFVCRRTTKIHMCSADHCTYAQLSQEGLVCTLTGLFLAQEMSLARSRLDPDIRVVGKEIYNASVARLPVDMSITPTSTTSTDMASELYKLANNHVEDVHHVLGRYHGDVKFIKQKVVQRKEWREHAGRAYDKQLLNETYVEILETDACTATQKWYLQQCERARKCKERGLPFTRKSMWDSWSALVESKYKSIYVGDVCEMNRLYRGYFINCILNIWEKFISMPEVAAREVQFSDCCTAILRALHEGFPVVVYMVEGVDRPFHNYSQMTDRQRLTAKKVSVQIIDAHTTSIFLAPPEIARGFQHAQNKKKRLRPEVQATKGFFITGKILPTRRERQTHNKLRNLQMTSIIPQKMKWHIVVNEMVEHVKTLAELMSYRLKDNK